MLERFQAKACPGLDPGWIPVRVKKTRQNKKIEPRSDSIGTEKALVGGLRAQRFGLRPRMWSKPCLIAAKRASIIDSNSRSVKIYGKSFSTPSRTSSPT